MCRELEFLVKKKTHVQLYNAVVCLSFFGFVPSAGIEPAHLAVLEFESSASTNSANWAALNWCANIELFFIS